jgi:hypothetical protein
MPDAVCPTPISHLTPDCHRFRQRLICCIAPEGRGRCDGGRTVHAVVVGLAADRCRLGRPSDLVWISVSCQCGRPCMKAERAVPSNLSTHCRIRRRIQGHRGCGPSEDRVPRSDRPPGSWCTSVRLQTEASATSSVRRGRPADPRGSELEPMACGGAVSGKRFGAVRRGAGWRCQSAAGRGVCSVWRPLDPLHAWCAAKTA